MSVPLLEYVWCLGRYGRLAGWGETGRLLGSIVAGKLGAASTTEASRSQQRWAFFQILSRGDNMRVAVAGKTEFRVVYGGEKVELGGVELALRVPDCDSSDGRVFEQVFLMRDYAGVLDWFRVSSPGTEINTILDIGANIGCAALFFCTRLPGPDIFCLEPEESNFARLRLNISLNGGRRIQCFRAALWTHRGNLSCSRAFRDGKEWGARFVEDGGDGTTSSQESPAIDIYELAQKAGFAHVDFLKMDVEGAEADLFRTQQFRDFLKEKVSRIAVEVHEEFIKIDEVTMILKSLGFQTNVISEFVCAVKKG